MMIQNYKLQQQQQQQPGQTEEREHEKVPSSKLDPSLLLHYRNMNNKSTIEDQQYGMMLRRRGILCQYSAKDETISLPLTSTFLPKEEVRDQTSDKFESKLKSKQCEKKTTERITREEDASKEKQTKDKIFSITTSVVLMIITLTLVLIFCLCACNRASMLVNAQYSNFGKIESGNNNVRPKVARQVYNGQHPAGYSQQLSHTQSRSSRYDPSSSSSSQQDNIESQLPASTSKTNSRHNSIDRFDAGEQIRPPLLRQPTTLKPLTMTSSPQQVSSNKGYNLQTAASQEAYFSPEDREQLIKNQENHYEGRGYSSDQGPIDGPSSDRDQYEKPNRWSQPESGSYDLGSAKSNNLELQSSKPSGLAPVASADNDDYEDEPNEASDQKRSNQVPEVRRPTSSASYNHAHRQYGRPSAANQASLAETSAGEAENEPSNDDYGGANDETHFSRKPNQKGERNMLNPSASYNQQSRKSQAAYNNNHGSRSNPSHISDDSRGSNHHHGHNNNNEDSSDEGHHGFGPGPNEAYMVDKAESIRPSLEHEEEGMNLGPAGEAPDSSTANEEDNRFDRRTMNQYNNEGSNLASSANNGQPLRAVANSAANEVADSDDVDEGNDNNEDAVTTSASSSSKAGSIKNVKPSKPMLRDKDSPKKGFKGVNPLWAMSSLGSPPAYSLPISIKPPAYKSSLLNQPRQHHLGVQNQHQHEAPSSMMSSSSNKASKVPYNPQDNPSHAGKYFIN